MEASPSGVWDAFIRHARPWLALALGVLVVLSGLWPLDIQRRCSDCPNDARTVPGQPGFTFGDGGMVIDEGGAHLLAGPMGGATALTVAVAAESATLLQQGPARMLTLSRDGGARSFTIGQQRDRLVFRLATPVTGENGSRPQTETALAITPGTRQLFVATYDGAAFRLYVNGALAAERLLAAGPINAVGADYQLVLGNETTGDRAWRGHLLDAAIWSTAMPPEAVAALTIDTLSEPSVDKLYHLGTRCPTNAAPEASPVASPDDAAHHATRAGHCLIPMRYRNDRDTSMLSLSMRAPSDLVLNALPWLVIGALAVGRPARRPLLAAAATLSLVALTVLGSEIAQAWIFSRSSSLIDALAALAGASIGIATATLSARRHDTRQAAAR
ncbi:MAG: LamG-like jellyroll fold domain-containing protein [Pseudomonadota bacterium]